MVLAWDSVLVSNIRDTGIGNALLISLINTVFNNQPIDLENLLADIGVEQLHRTVFLLKYQTQVLAFIMDLQNFFAVHTVLTWDIVGGTLIIEAI